MMKNFTVLGGLAWVVVYAGPLLATDPAMPYQKEVSAASKAEETLVAVPLDAEVYAATQSGLADLRLKDVDGKSVPYLLRKSQEAHRRTVRLKTWTANKPTLKPLDDGGLEITVELDKDDPSPSGLTLVTPLQNFEQRVRVLTSADGQTWEPAGSETVIFDYSRYMDVRNDRVAVPPSPHKFYRIVIDDVTSEQQSQLLELTRHLQVSDETGRTERITIDRRPFRIDRIEFWQDGKVEGVTGDHKRDYPVVDFKAETDEKHQTVVTIDTRREPLTSLTLQTKSKNFSRACVVEVQEQRGVQSSWRQIASATLSRIDFKALQREQLEITFPETRATKYRLVIDNRDNAPLDVTGIKAEGNVYELVFLSGSKKTHQLSYGNADVTAPSYDTAAISAMLNESYRPEMLSLAAEQKVETAPAAYDVSKAINDPRLLTGIIAVLVVALGLGLYSAVKRIDQVPPTDQTPPPAA